MKKKMQTDQDSSADENEQADDILERGGLDENALSADVVDQARKWALGEEDGESAAPKKVRKPSEDSNHRSPPSGFISFHPFLTYCLLVSCLLFSTPRIHNPTSFLPSFLPSSPLVQGLMAMKFMQKAADRNRQEAEDAFEAAMGAVSLEHSTRQFTFPGVISFDRADSVSFSKMYRMICYNNRTFSMVIGGLGSGSVY